MKTAAKTNCNSSFPWKLLSIALVCLSQISMSGETLGQERKQATTSFVVVSMNAPGHISYKDSIGEPVVVTDIGSGTLIEFKVRYIQGKAFTQWQVKGEKEDGLFVVERSLNGKDYEQIGFRKGVGVSTDVPLLYCWIDESPIAEAGYRLMKVYEDGRYYYSDSTGSSPVQLIKIASKEEPPLIAAGK